MDDNKKHSLGQRAFFVFFFARLKWVVILAAIVGGLWYAERFFAPDSEVSIFFSYGVYILFLIWLAMLIMVTLRAYLEYRYYTYTFTNEAFIFTYGVMVRNEQAALYHQIQNVSIQRGVADRMIGVSRILIFLDGDESGHAKIVIPALGRKKAKMVQKELLVRARKSVVG